MAFPDHLLAADEEVVLHLHPHWKVLVWPVVLFLAAGAAGGFAAASIGSTAARLVVVAVVAVLVLWLTVVPVLRWRTTHFVLTTHRVLLRRGILSRTGRDIPLARINDLSFAHSLLERMLGCGTLMVESAGERGQVVLTAVPNVEQVHAELYQLVDDEADLRERRAGGGG